MKLSTKQLNLSQDMVFTGGDIHLDNGRILLGDGSAVAPSISFTSDTDTGLFLNQVGELTIAAGSNAYMFLKDDGSVEFTGTTSIALQAGSTAQRPEDPLDGALRYNLETDRFEVWADVTWQNISYVSDLADYLKIDGTRSMSGSLNMGGNSITNVGTIGGVTITSHASRHLPGGADALTTASAVGLTATTTASEGSAASFARSDHTHSISTAAAIGLSATTTNSLGSASSLARSDHTHAIPTASAVAVTMSTTNGTGTSSSFARADHTHTLTLDGDLVALAALTTTGMMARTAADTYTMRSISGTGGRVSVSNGDGIAGNPTIDLVTTGVTAGSYQRVTVDAYGRVTSGSLGYENYTAVRLESPMTTGSWPIKAQAAAYLDPSHPSLTVRGFDDTTPEGVGITSAVPAGATSCNITIVGRARTAPGGAVNSQWNLYTHEYPLGTLANDWYAAIPLNQISIASGNVYPYSVTTNVTLATMGLAAGQPFQMEITRNANAGTDTLSGDFLLFWIRLEWL